MIGIDIVDVARLASALDRAPGLENRLFTATEIAYCRQRSRPVESLAGTLAAKEAVIKSMRLGPLVAWARRIEIHREKGVPMAMVGNQPVMVSISHDGGVAAAVAVVP